MKYAIYILLLALSGPVLFAQGTDAAYVKKLSKLYKNTVPIIQPEELQEAMDAEEELVLLDTRQPREYEVSHLPGAKFVNFNKFNKKDFAKMDRSAKVIVYCSVGYRSERIGEKLKKMGFENVQNLYGGIFEWKNQGHGVVNESGSETERVHCYNKDWGRWLKDGEKVYK